MSLRVLIVDDEPLARTGVRTRLSAHPDVSLIGECSDGASALQFLQSQSPDLLFIDVKMPGLSGLDVLEALAPEQRPLTVLLTAYEQFALRAFELRALDYLLKPVDDERFADALDRARHTLALRRDDLRRDEMTAVRRRRTMPRASRCVWASACSWCMRMRSIGSRRKATTPACTWADKPTCCVNRCSGSEVNWIRRDSRASIVRPSCGWTGWQKCRRCPIAITCCACATTPCCAPVGPTLMLCGRRYFMNNAG